VEQTSDLSGAQWTTSGLYLRGISLVRRNSEWHHFDPLGTAGVLTNGSASVVSNNLYDAFGVLRYTQGSAQTPWRWDGRRLADESLVSEACPAESIPDVDTPVSYLTGLVSATETVFTPRVRTSSPPILMPLWTYSGGFNCPPTLLEDKCMRSKNPITRLHARWAYCSRCVQKCEDYCYDTYDYTDDAYRHDRCIEECHQRYHRCRNASRGRF